MPFSQDLPAYQEGKGIGTPEMPGAKRGGTARKTKSKGYPGEAARRTVKGTGSKRGKIGQDRRELQYALEAKALHSLERRATIEQL